MVLVTNEFQWYDFIVVICNVGINPSISPGTTMVRKFPWLILLVAMFQCRDRPVSHSLRDAIDGENSNWISSTFFDMARPISVAWLPTWVDLTRKLTHMWKSNHFVDRFPVEAGFLHG